MKKQPGAIQKPVTVKIRKGFDEEHINAVEMAHIAQESGAAAIAVHGGPENSIIPARQIGRSSER